MCQPAYVIVIIYICLHISVFLCSSLHFSVFYVYQDNLTERTVVRRETLKDLPLQRKILLLSINHCFMGPTVQSTKGVIKANKSSQVDYIYDAVSARVITDHLSPKVG